MIKIVLVDDHALFRRSLRELLEASGQVQVLAEADDCDSAIPLIAGLQPEIVVTDLNLGCCSGLDLIGHLSRAANAAPVLVMSMHSDPVYLERVRNAGAAGFVSKSQADEQLLEALVHLRHGTDFFDASQRPKPAPRCAS